MDSKFKNIVYGEVNLDFDQELFAKEFDEFILPYSLPFVAVHTQWTFMPLLNKHWKIISDDKYQKYNEIIESGGTELEGMTHYWRAINLIRGAEGPENITGASWRSINRHNQNTLKTQFQNLEIVRWIYQNIYAEKIVGIHCVSLEPGQFATMHRDAHWANKDTPNPALKNGFFKEGFIVLCLNVTSGGAPLLWALDHEKTKPKKIDAKCYIGNDYFIHGVPEVSSRRRQIRISFKPKKDFFNLIKEETIIALNDGYEYY